MPPIPLELAYPLEVPGPEVAGARLLRELPAEAALRVVEALRMVHAVRDVERTGPLFTRDAVWAWEARRMRELARTALEEPDAELALEDGLAEIARLIADPEGLDRRKLSWACLMVLECALTEGWRETAAAFAEAAAIACPYAPYPAYIIGKLHRRYGNYREAEAWLKRGARVARWAEDWENYALALNSLGNLSRDTGNFKKSRQTLVRALRVAHRYKLKQLSGEILHDLFGVVFIMGEHGRAEEYAHAALQRYGPHHPRLPALAYDTAYFWMTQGYFARALSVLKPLLLIFGEAEERLQVIAATARAAGACGEASLFREMWDAAWDVTEFLCDEARLAAALVDVGLGASNLEDWDRARIALERAAEIAGRRNEGDTVLRADAALAEVGRRHRADHELRRSHGGQAGRPSDVFAYKLLQVLDARTQG
jgi:tetratricopeptide (TPR) repeat protein